MRYLLVWLFAFGFFYSPVFGQIEFTSSNLPIIIIDTHGFDIWDEPKVTADMGIIDNGPGQRNNITDPFNNYNGKIGIETRGSTSQGFFPKKPYGIELRDETGTGISVSLLGMPAEEDWSLIATYNDKSLMRDALAYKLGRDLGGYAPRTRFCELVLKSYTTVGGETTVRNEYRGIYMLTEKIKRDKNRVDISKLEPTEISGDDLTGGYILKIDKPTGNSGLGFASSIPPPKRDKNQTIYFQYEYPKYDEIVPQQRQYIQSYMNNFENVLNSSTFADPVNGYRKYINVDSFIDFLIVNEVSKNVDGYRLSTFMYKDKDSNGGKLTMGPVWDFNLAFGNADYCEGAPTSGWMYNFNSVCNYDGWLVPFWWDRLLSDAKFRRQLGARWQELRATKLNIDTITDYIDSTAFVLSAEAAQRNFNQWPVLGMYVWPNAFVGQTYQSEVNWLKNWIDNRISWLDSHMPSPEVVTSNEPEPDGGVFSIQAFPNPFRNHLQVNYSIPKPCEVTIELFDLIGRRVREIKRTHQTSGEFEAAFDAINLSSGIYYFKASSSLDRKFVMQRVVKQTN